jgi:PAS domain S-box-containing protein
LPARETGAVNQEESTTASSQPSGASTPPLGAPVPRPRSSEGEEQLRLLIEAVGDYAIYMLDPQGHVTTWNTGAERLKGYRSDEIIGRHFSTFYPGDAVAAGLCEHELEVAAREGRFEDEGWRVRKDGSQFWANIVISAVRDRRGELVGFSKVTRDLTERKLAEEERAARIAAEQANRAKDEFLAVLGHELRNPLAPIVTALQLIKLRSDGRLTKEQQVIERQVNQMVRLVEDLLDVSRIAKSKVTLKKQRIDLRDVVARSIETASAILEQRRHTVRVDAPPHEIAIEADEARLTQVFANLVTNAAKYTNPGGHIRVVLEPAGREVVVRVIDDGIGIEPALLPRMFDLFVQGQGTERAGGLGIGLTLVRNLVELHGGAVTAHSEGPGRGSELVVRLPLPAERTD